MKTTCIYHAECIDGAAAAAVVYQKFEKVELLPAKHGDIPPDHLEGRRVVIVDFSFPAPVMRRIYEEAGEVLWFDHHKTALSIQQEVGFGILDMEESGATLTWKQLHPNQPVPKILQYVRDKDIWRWELPDSREISADLRETEHIHNPASLVWKTLLNSSSLLEWNDMIKRGRHSLRLLKNRLERVGKKGFPITIDGHDGFAVNWTGDSSEVGEHIYKELKYPVAVIFSYDGKQWVYSLRSNSVDVSEIAARRGGGGHPGAAGFRTDTNDIEWLLKSKVR